MSNIDLAGQQFDLSGTPPGPDMALGCGSYQVMTVAQMRAGTPGCYELDGVVVIANQPHGSTSTSANLFVQDAAGGAFSAIETKCTKSHPCMTPVQTVRGFAIGTIGTVKGTYIRSTSTHFEEFYLDSFTMTGTGAAPAATTVTIADIERSSVNYGISFQKVTVNVSADPLLMYDLSPTEFVFTGATSCPFQTGFGMVPMSASATAGGACMGMTQPPGQTTPNAKEVLVDTRFYKTFTFSSDCKCAAMFMNPLVTPTQKISSSAAGIAIFDVPFGSTTGHMSIAPLVNTEFNIM